MEQGQDPVTLSQPSTQSSEFWQKFLWAAIAAIIFFVVSLPMVYKQTNKMVSPDGTDCPFPETKFLHAIIFFVISFLAMKIFGKSVGGKEGLADSQSAQYSFYATLLFFVIASPETYAITKKLFPWSTKSASLCPTLKGVLLHSAVFLLVTIAVMYFPSK
jgi:hypothetical protein